MQRGHDVDTGDTLSCGVQHLAGTCPYSDQDNMWQGVFCWVGESLVVEWW